MNHERSVPAVRWQEKVLGALTERSSAQPLQRFDDVENLTRHPYMLAIASSHVAQGGSTPGVDGESPSILQSSRNAELLDRLGIDLGSDRYRPDALRRAYVSSGGRRRAIAIPTVRDRVAQVAANGVVDAIVEARFSNASFGFRRGRGPLAAIGALVEILEGGAGNSIIRLDIERAFESVDHQRLLNILRRHIVDARLVRRIHRWVRTRIVVGSRVQLQRRGLAMGMPSAPLLFNMFMTPLDRFLEREGAAFVRYADDVVIAVAGNEVAAARFLVRVEEFIRQELGLSISRDSRKKTLISDVATGVDFLGVRFEITDDGVRVRPSNASLERISKQLHRGAIELGESTNVEGLSDALVRMNAIIRPRRAYFGGCGDDHLRDIAAAMLHRHLDKFGAALDMDRQGNFVLVDSTMTRPRESAEEPKWYGRDEHPNASMRKPDQLGRDRISKGINSMSERSLPMKVALGRRRDSPPPGAPRTSEERMTTHASQKAAEKDQVERDEDSVWVFKEVDYADANALAGELAIWTARRAWASERFSGTQKQALELAQRKRLCEATLRELAREAPGRRSDAATNDRVVLDPEYQRMVVEEVRLGSEKLDWGARVDRCDDEIRKLSRLVELRRQEAQLHGRGFLNERPKPKRRRARKRGR